MVEAREIHQEARGIIRGFLGIFLSLGLLLLIEYYIGLEVVLGLAGLRYLPAMDLELILVLGIPLTLLGVMIVKASSGKPSASTIRSPITPRKHTLSSPGNEISTGPLLSLKDSD